MASSATNSKGFPGSLPYGTAAAPPEVAGGEITLTEGGSADVPSDALSARSVLPLTARVIMVYVNELPHLNGSWHMPQAFCCASRSRSNISWGQPAARNAVIPVGLLRDSGDSRCGWSRLYSLLRSMVSAVLQGPPCPGVRAHVVFFRGIHLPHHSCPIQARYISDSSALRYDTPNQVFEIVGAPGLEPTNPSLVRSLIRGGLTA